jgi:cyclopropane-fatty-acyl-phospholipid synthase
MTRDLFVFEQAQAGDVMPKMPSAAAKLLSRFFERFTAGTLVLELPSGERVSRRAEEPGPEGILKLNHWRALRSLLVRGDIGFAEGYMDGDWTSPNLLNFFDWACVNEKALRPAWTGSLLERVSDRFRHMQRANTRRGSRRNISEHYDLGNDFYAAWLDAGKNYSSGLYSGSSQSLEDAQIAKLDRVINLLDVSPDMSVLEIGCGWGALAERLIAERSCRVTGLTLSREQLKYAQERLGAVDHFGTSRIILQDYRDTSGTFDRIVSIEMLEATGEQYWPEYFRKIRGCLAPGGVAVLQVITLEERRFSEYRRRPDFIQRYIFPGGMLPTVERLKELAFRAELKLDHLEFFGQSYAKTLAAWRERFLGAWPSIARRRLGDERFRNMWEYYLAYCEVGFRRGALDVGLYRLVRE